MKVKSALLLAFTGFAVLLPLTVTFVHLNYSFHRRSWEKSRVEGQREAAHGNFDKAATFYQLALRDASQFPINGLMYATTRGEAADIYEHLKNFGDSHALYAAALSAVPENDDRQWLSLKFACLSGLGRLAFAEGKTEVADSTLQSALPVYMKLLAVDNRTTENLIAGDEQIHNLLTLALIYSGREDEPRAVSYIRQTEKLLNSFPLESDSRRNLKELLRKYKLAPGDLPEVSVH